MTALYATLTGAGLGLIIIGLAYYAIWYLCQIYDGVKNND